MDRKSTTIGMLRTRGELLLRVFCITLMVFQLGRGGSAQAADERNSPAGLVVYSDLNFIELEREFVGLQVAIVPDSEGQKVLWRSAGPFLNAPLLLDAVKIGNALQVVVPDGDRYKGIWKLEVKGNTMYAVGPEGQKYGLKRISLK